MSIVYVKENEDIVRKVIDQGIDLRKIEKQLLYIGKKINNNKVGYFQFKIDEEYIKICVIPKIINIDEDKNSVEKKFLYYINICLEIMDKYDKNKANIYNNYIDIVKNSNTNNNIENLNSKIKRIYLNALINIQRLIEKINLKKIQEEKFYDYQLRGKIDVKSNIKELNKFKIHQFKKKIYYYNDIIINTYMVIDYFINSRLNLIEENQELKILSYRLRNLLKVNYKIDFKKLNIDNIISKETAEIFKERNASSLYNNLLFLLDQGYFLQRVNCKEYKVIKNTISICFDPSIIYEYFIYNNEKNDKIKIKPKNEGIIDETRIPYRACKDGKRKPESDIKGSVPDFLLEKEWVKDAKWKKLEGDPSEEDLNKLKRDCIIQNVNLGILVYPEVNINKKGISYKCIDPEGKEIEIKVEELDMLQGYKEE